jgi:hypothetical protein
MRIFYTTTNNGDGSSSVSFYESQECIDMLEESDPETYGSGEGGSYFDVEGTITGITIETMEDVLAQIADMQDE